MKLPAIPFLKKKEDSEFYLSLIFQQDSITGILFQDIQKTLHILASREEVIDVELADTEEIITAADKVISSLELSLPEGGIVEKTIFAVPHPWVEEGRIIPEKLAELKKISAELALVPMGFIVSIEAIVAFLKKKEGAPINSVFVELSEKKVFVYLVRADKIVDVKSSQISESIEKTVEHLLENTVMDVLPPKIVLLNNKEAGGAQQKFISYQWTKEIAFAHLPQVSVLDKGFENEAVINGVATQMGIDVLGDIVVKKAESIAEEVVDEVEMENGNFGFSQKDIALESEETLPKEEHAVEPIVNIAGEDKDYIPESRSYQDSEEGIHSPAKSMIPSIFTSFNLSKILKNPFSFNKGIRTYIIPLAALLFVIAFGYVYYSYIIKAEVSIFTDKKEFKDTVAITLSTTEDTSFDKKILKISTTDSDVSGDDLIDVTGKKETGEKAKGEIKIFNKTENTQKLPKGISIKSSSGLEFVLTDSVEIASTSSFSTEFSSSKVKVEAAKFGKEYNIPSGGNFTVANFSASDVFAKNETAFSGGTKEEIQVVSQDDMTKLEENLSTKLFDEAKKNANSKLSAGQAFIPASLSEKVTEKKFDKKLGDEAKSLKLSESITVTLGLYGRDEMDKFIKSSDSFKVPADFSLDKDSEISLSDIKQNKDDITATLTFHAIFKPQLVVGELPAKIAGKSSASAEKTLKGIEGITDAKVNIKNNLPLLPVILPLQKTGISIQVKSENN